LHIAREGNVRRHVIVIFHSALRAIDRGAARIVQRGNFIKSMLEKSSYKYVSGKSRNI